MNEQMPLNLGFLTVTFKLLPNALSLFGCNTVLHLLTTISLQYMFPQVQWFYEVQLVRGTD